MCIILEQQQQQQQQQQKEQPSTSAQQNEDHITSQGRNQVIINNTLWSDMVFVLLTWRAWLWLLLLLLFYNKISLPVKKNYIEYLSTERSQSDILWHTVELSHTCLQESNQNQNRNRNEYRNRNRYRYRYRNRYRGIESESEPKPKPKPIPIPILWVESAHP